MSVGQQPVRNIPYLRTTISSYAQLGNLRTNQTYSGISKCIYEYINIYIYIYIYKLEWGTHGVSRAPWLPLQKKVNQNIMSTKYCLLA